MSSRRRRSSTRTPPRIASATSGPSSGRSCSRARRRSASRSRPTTSSFASTPTKAASSPTSWPATFPVTRSRCVELGGFDENFVGAAYRFETDFALRVAAAGGRIWFEPHASIDHLKLSTGGLRSYGDHRTSASPFHSAGDYYFALHHRRPLWRYALRRLRANVLR